MSINQAIQDRVIVHQVELLRYSQAVRDEIWQLLDASEADIRAAILRYDGAGLDTPAGLRELERLLEKIRESRERAFRGVRAYWLAEMTSFAKSEPLFLTNIVAELLPVEVTFKLPPADVLAEIATSRPFEGRTLPQWFDKLEQDDQGRLEAQIKIGLAQNEHPNQIARRIVGTVRKKGADGIAQVTRRDAAAISRTVSSGIANEGRRELILANEDIVQEEVFVATLDSRTTPICQSLDGNRYKPGEGPRLPLHFGERSTYAPVIDGELIGARPLKPTTEQSLIREYARENGLDGRLRRRASLPRGHKGKFDAFARARVRELVGTTPAKTTYADSLARQSAAVQDDILGATRGALFRRGGLTLDKFVEPTGRRLSLAELAARYEGAFERANLNPSDFL
jgi:SPP1 gp7 family putative phage head morphogenesis protein